ncbi:hypothetical protein BH10PSE5_BH10PSE5_01270 [soil metagenome]
MLRSFFRIAALAALCLVSALYAAPAMAEPFAYVLRLGEPFAFALTLGVAPVVAWAIVALARNWTMADHQAAGFATFLRPQTGLPEPTSVA